MADIGFSYKFPKLPDQPNDRWIINGNLQIITMTNSLRLSAQNGDTKALEALMNKFFNTKGIDVKVGKTGSLLKIILESTDIPDKKLLGSIKKGIDGINPKGFDAVAVTGKSKKEKESWTTQFKLTCADAERILDNESSSNSAELPESPSLKEKNEWYQSPGLVVISLIFLPFVGIPLTWSIKWSKQKKVITSLSGGIWLLIMIIVSVSQSQTRSLEGAFKDSPEEARSELLATQASEDSPVENQVIEVVDEPLVVDRSFEDAVNQAMAAANASQNASSKEQWDETSSLWESAIQMMKDIPQSNVQHATSQLKVTEYQKNLDYAKQRSIDLTPNLGVSKSEIRRLFEVISHSNKKGLMRKLPETQGYPVKRAGGEHPDEAMSSKSWSTAFLP